MNEKVKKALAWIVGIGTALLALLCGKWRRDANTKRVSDAKDCVANGRQTVEGIRDGNQQLKDKADGITDASNRLADEIGESAGSVERAGQSVGNARDAVRFSLEILDEAEKRNKTK